MKYVGILGSLLIFAGGFLPIAFINEEMIVILPFFITPGEIANIWGWRDISAFAMTYGVLSLIFPYFLIKEKSFGIIITSSLTIVCIIFIWISLWMADLKIEQIDSLSLNYGISWLVIIFGLILILFQVIMKRKNKLEEEEID